jgi:hypothetical protein
MKDTIFVNSLSMHEATSGVDPGKGSKRPGLPGTYHKSSQSISKVLSEYQNFTANFKDFFT